MKKPIVPTLLLAFAGVAQAQEIPNRLIDYDGFAGQVAHVGEIRQRHRLTEDEFIRMANEPGTVVLDARSAEKYAQLHIKGARNLSLPDITADELASILPDKSTRVLIYCNNNFLNAPGAFPSKAVTASLNIYTYNVLHSYGYENVYELGPLFDIHQAKIVFEGTDVGRQ
ncbi:rhodanese-like domain-containing protein [Luteimonas sp. SX5]|uniref:Rhodanese-like domain-containing protein n=1 Tax=Luteimonas galliterrae TaxID=2940486 RepID=A0ABT0MF64_9GAMM|nr:rhodanese-like domain-containing protein [Luteimonas galliterrae]MCL1633504.1 rhodanese-like domain-containing protein [Luteimonas galliterrae]